ncbi:MAG: polysaccharide deacetylase family protein [Dysgonamonadaceae bacterium]|jgi:hypothetical protein|nr:polysaccharide deacetylase family protein [Dysgonamonadaceae bacterium]
MITIYFPLEKTSRLKYVAEHLFNHILGVDFTIISDKKELSNKDDILINYSEENLKRGIRIIPNGLLTEENLTPREELAVSEWKGLFVFFSNKKGDIPFDLFSAAFYLLTLYQEYFPTRLDKHGRFDHSESLLYKNEVLEVPVIDRWAYFLKEEIEKAGYKTADFTLRKYRTISTYDVDYPFLFRNKGWIKNIGGALKDLLNGDLDAIKNRALVQLHLKEDPYLKALTVINDVQTKLRKEYYLFVLLGDKGKYGVSTVYSPKRFYDYIKKLSAVTIGLHPSYESFRNLEMLMKEKMDLERILERKVNVSRQHFLRMRSPETFQELNLTGIQEDYSLAFAHAPGFRSGTAVPYFFYDIQKEEKSSLMIHPTIVMDSTFIYHMKLTPVQALEKIKKLADECKKSGGDFLSLWHNSNLAHSVRQNPWISVYLQSYKYAVSMEKESPCDEKCIT